MTEIQKALFAMQDAEYKKFSASLLPTVDPDTVIGVRVPLLRKYAKGLVKTESAEQFLKELPHQYLEENHLHSFLIGEMRDADACYAALDAFLPYVDNWAVCDSLRPKVLSVDSTRLLAKIDEYLQSAHPYTVRFGIELLMLHYLDEHFDFAHLTRVAAVKSEEYYVNMMIAWYFATALSKQWEAALPYLEQHRLPDWVHRKTVQKAIESNCITPEQKAYLRTLR
ncbi:MAG: DNA alkylation repair protein [Clostridia bacterium]|nr:DNA alkylation repair protein [Clostridia bacterium]